MFESIQPVTISEKALSEIRKVMLTKNIPTDYGVRVGVKGGGCGVSLLLGFDKRKEEDQVYYIEEIPVFVDKRHTMYIIGKEVDFYEGEGVYFLHHECALLQSSNPYSENVNYTPCPTPKNKQKPLSYSRRI